MSAYQARSCQEPGTLDSHVPWPASKGDPITIPSLGDQDFAVKPYHRRAGSARADYAPAGSQFQRQRILPLRSIVIGSVRLPAVGTHDL